MNEREMFEEWYKSVESQYHKALNNYDAEFDCYTNDYIQCRYFAWQASASRDGYKLVPLQPSNITIVVIERKVENQLEASGINADPFRLDGENIYKAMIGVCDE